MHCDATNSVRLQVKLLDFTWKHEFMVLNGGPFPLILGLDFLQLTSMVVDMASRTFSFRFVQQCSGRFGSSHKKIEGEPFLQQLVVKVCESAERQVGGPEHFDVEMLSFEFPTLFSLVLGTGKCEPYDNELCDAAPVRSALYRCAKAAVFKEMVDGLLEQGVVRPIKSPYASPAFLVPKCDGGFHLVVDYRKVNAKVVFDSYPMPTIEQALDQFSGASVFSVLDLNSAYYQIPLSEQSRRVTAFCTPFGLFEFNKLPMGISVVSQGQGLSMMKTPRLSSSPRF